MADTKITKEEFLAWHAAAKTQPVLDAIEDHMRRHPWMSREQVVEIFRIEALPQDEQETHYAMKAKAELKERLLGVEGIDDALAQKLTDGGVPYFHTIASSLPYEQFHYIAHVMIGSPAAGC